MSGERAIRYWARTSSIRGSVAVALETKALGREEELVIDKEFLDRLMETCRAAGETEAQYYDLAEQLDDLEGLDAVEVNISCPNVEQGGRCPAQDPEITTRVLKGCLERTNLPIIAKLTPNVEDITVIARAGSG